MGKLMILIWICILGLNSLLKLNLFDKDTKGDHINVANKLTILAVSFDNHSENHGFITQIDSAKSCAKCHDDLLDDENVHAPAKKDCQRCHISTGAEHSQENNIAGFTLKTDVPELCYECHDPKNEEEFVHEPTQKGECLTCHDIHDSPNIYLVKSDPVSTLCYECHELEIPENNLVHGAVTDGDCIGCHNPHQADNKSFMKSSNLGRLCRSCHKSIRKELKKEHLHKPFKKKCFSCHNGHSSKEANLSDLKTEDLCFSCHEEVHDEIKKSGIVHGAINEKESCLNCHSPHASSEEKILKANEKDMCLSCHDTRITSDSSSIAAIGPLLKEGNTIHGAIKKESCSGCHKPHASDKHTLLTRAFPVENYAPANVDNFDLCFSCHDKQLIENPITKTATNFRNRDQNLHYVHIHDEKGRNCNLCHDVHGADNKYLIKESTQYGNWQMPIEFEYTDKGGSCLTGCHEKYSYERIVVLPDSLRLTE